jgi:hypothetical protein
LSAQIGEGISVPFTPVTICKPAVIGNAEAQLSCANDQLDKRHKVKIKVIFFIYILF